MMPYFDMAVQYQYRVEIEEPTSPWWMNDIAPYLLEKHLHQEKLDAAAYLLWQKNQETHCVLLDAIKKMLRRYQPLVNFDDLARVYVRGLPSDQQPQNQTVSLTEN